MSAEGAVSCLLKKQSHLCRRSSLISAEGSVSSGSMLGLPRPVCLKTVAAIYVPVSSECASVSDACMPSIYTNDPVFGQTGLGKQCSPRSDLISVDTVCHSVCILCCKTINTVPILG